MRVISLNKTYLMVLNYIKAASIFLLLFSGVVCAQEDARYYLRFPDYPAPQLEVELQVSGWKEKEAAFRMAAWTPGSYMIRDYAGLVSSIVALSKAGDTLPLRKQSKDHWIVERGEHRIIRLRYTVYAGELSPRSSYIESGFASLTPASILIYPANYSGSFRMDIEPPSTWKHCYTGMPAIGNNPWKRTASGLDELLDSPLHLGNPLHLSFHAGGAAHELVIEGGGNFDTARIREDLSCLVEGYVDLFGGNPNERYMFLLTNTDDGYGGLEHYNSTAMIYPRRDYTPESRYRVFLGLLSHEYFHTWNGKRIRPIELSTFDYNREQYTSLLWVVEGFTSYYDDLMIRRCGQSTEREYLERVSDQLNRVFNRFGDAVQPLSESSFDSWIKYYKPAPNSTSVTVSYYDKGMVMALAMDLDLLRSSAGAFDLDDVMRDLYAQYEKDPETGYTEADLIRLLEKYSRHSWSPFFERYIHGTAQLNFREYFSAFGLDLTDRQEGRPVVQLGLSLNGNVVQRVVDQLPVWKAGLQAGDEILAINGYRFEGDLQEELRNWSSGDSLHFVYSRERVVREAIVWPEEIAKFDYVLSLSAEATPEQLALYQRWIGTRSQPR